MLSRYTHKKLTWIDLESPTKEEVRRVMDEFGVHPLVAEELLIPSLRPKVDFYGNQAYVVLHFPAIGHSHNGGVMHEIDFVIGKEFLITVHYETVDPLLEFSKMFAVNSVIERSNMADHAGFLYFYIMRELYKNIRQDLYGLEGILGSIEDNIFADGEEEMVKTISEVNRKLINARQAIRFHKDILESFEIVAKEMFGEKFLFYTRSITGEYFEIANVLDGLKGTLDDLWKTNDSLLSSKTNRTMKILTMVTVILLPASLVGQLFGISSAFVPFMDNPQAIFTVINAMFIAAFAMYAVLRGNRWL